MKTREELVKAVDDALSDWDATDDGAVARAADKAAWAAYINAKSALAKFDEKNK